MSYFTIMEITALNYFEIYMTVKNVYGYEEGLLFVSDGLLGFFWTPLQRL